MIFVNSEREVSFGNIQSMLNEGNLSKLKFIVTYLFREYTFLATN